MYIPVFLQGFHSVAYKKFQDFPGPGKRISSDVYI